MLAFGLSARTGAVGSVTPLHAAMTITVAARTHGKRIL
jgi:hypothetical protein